MRHRHLHPWDVTPGQAEAIQHEIAASLPPARPLRAPGRVAGAAVRGRGDVVCAAVAVLSLPDLEIQESAVARAGAGFRYRPGLMAFRVGPALLAAFEQIAAQPDAVLFAGHGAAHPRGLGLATHLGALLQVPSVGCADRLLVGRGAPPGPHRADRSSVSNDRGEAVALWLRTRPGARPLAVSPGFALTLDDAAAVVLGCLTSYRFPEPLRIARRLAREAAGG